MSDRQHEAVVLIGMPGAGKSTLGVLLAKALAKPFIDTDLLIQAQLGTTLQAYLEDAGYLALRKVEEEVLLAHDFRNCVVSTGGSAVYSTAAMKRLATFGPRVYLEISLATLHDRVRNQNQRGLACAPGTTLEMLYHERRPLYEAVADIVINLDGQVFDDSLAQLREALGPVNTH